MEWEGRDVCGVGGMEVCGVGGEEWRCVEWEARDGEEGMGMEF